MGEVTCGAVTWQCQSTVVWVEVRRVYESDARTQIEARAFYSFLAPPKATIFVTHGSVRGQLSGLGDLSRHHLASSRPPHITVSLWKNPRVLSLWNTRVRKATAERYKLDAVHVGTVLYRALIPYQRFCSIEIYVEGVERPGVSFNRINGDTQCDIECVLCVCHCKRWVHRVRFHQDHPLQGQDVA
jgi:hypothetical protein